MDIENNSIVTDVDTEVLDSQIAEISNEFAETYCCDEEDLEMLVAKAMKLGELYERKKWQAAKAQSEKALLEQFEINNKLVKQIEKLKAQAVPEGFVVVPIEMTSKQIESYMKGKVFPASMGEHMKFVERLSKDYKAMIEAQEQSHEY